MIRLFMIQVKIFTTSEFNRNRRIVLLKTKARELLSGLDAPGWLL